MTGTYEVILTNSDGLSRELWRFYVSERSISLTRWANEARETKRHGWKPIGATFNAYNRGRFGSAPEPKPHNAALDALREQMRVRVDEMVGRLRND